VNTDPDVEKSVTTDIVVIIQLAIASVTLSANGHSSGTRAGTHSKPFIRQPGFENASNDNAVANLNASFWLK
jgi:hypothetical protein